VDAWRTNRGRVKELTVTKPQEWYRVTTRLRALKEEVREAERQLDTLRREMGHPPDEQIERALEMGKTIVGGCTRDP
jgi:hypothetical protein